METTTLARPETIVWEGGFFPAAYERCDGYSTEGAWSAEHKGGLLDVTFNASAKQRSYFGWQAELDCCTRQGEAMSLGSAQRAAERAIVRMAEAHGHWG